MNERIKELAREAGLPTYNTSAIPTKLEKFAELILKECLQELEASKKCNPYNGDLFDCEYNQCINEQTTMLKEHFGVEDEEVL